MIACVGETLEQREAGTTMEVVAAQTKAIAGIDFKTKISANFCCFLLVGAELNMISNFPHL